MSQVLTDEPNFSFEQGVADVGTLPLAEVSSFHYSLPSQIKSQAMNFNFIMTATDGKFFKIVADVTDKLLSKRMDIVVQQGDYATFSFWITRDGSASEL